ncbi:MAG: inositol monophosphatase [Bacteroidaceae bacterium]|nr:inositol monophosphatase [Bacteroidaceae bacterium]
MEQTLLPLLREVEQVARRAGAFLRREREDFTMERVEQKHAHDYVSDVDRRSERLVVDELHSLLPEAGFVTEEGLGTFRNEERYWVIDPLDGTTNFIHGLRTYAVSIALCKGSEIELGVVYDAAVDEMFSAYRGGGAWLNGRPIHVSTHPFSQALMGVELPYNAEGYASFGLSVLRHLYGRVGGIRMNGSAAIALCHVAAGRLDGWLEKYLGRYDYMAGAIIVQEAGGQMTDFYGSPEFTMGDNVVATNGQFHDELLSVIRQYAANYKE